MTETQYTKVPLKENVPEKTEEISKYGYGVRHIQSFIFFMCLSLGYISRAHLGVSIVAMVNIHKESNNSLVNYNETVENDNTSITNTNGTKSDEWENYRQIQLNKSLISNVVEDGIEISTNMSEKQLHLNNFDGGTSTWDIYRIYDWPKPTQEMVLGSFFLGYFVMMFPMGLVCQRWGGKLPLQICLFLNGILSVAVPWLLAWGGWKVLCACRIIQGLAQAGLYPSIHTLLANWVPVNERSSLSSYVYTGSGFGTIVAFQLGGVLADSRWGWPSTFWTSGIMCLIGFTILTVFGANKPDEHKSISKEEKHYISGHTGDDNKKKLKTPWKKILRSRHVWACFSGHIGSGASYVFFFTQVPTYMHGILNFDIKNSGLLSSLPYIIAFFATIVIGYLSDYFTNRKIITVKNARIISNTIGTFLAALSLAGVSYTRNSTLAVVLFILTLSCHTACHSGWMVNYIDLAPNFSGAQMAFGNTLCNSVVLLLPIIVSSIVTDVLNPYQWRITFLLIAGMLVTANIFYVLFMSADVQSWNDSEETNEPEDVKLEENLKK